MPTNKDFIPMKGGYEDSPVYKIARCIYAVTYHFAETYLRRGDRTVDQMVQAARSAKQNIVEGSVDGATSHEMEIKLLNTARGSVHELKADYEDYLTTRGLEQWPLSDPRTAQTRLYCRSHNDPREYLEACKTRSDETIANIALTLIHQYDVLMVRLIEASKQRFLEQGGIKEEMYRARMNYRSARSAQSAQSAQSSQSSQSTQSSQSSQRAPSSQSTLLALLVSLLLFSCSDWRDGILPEEEEPALSSQAAIAFSASVSAGRKATRADGSIVNLNETSLPESTKRSYWRYNPTSGEVEKDSNTFYAGVFGCYTGEHKWAELVRLSKPSESSESSENSENSENSESSKILNKYYSANLLYNQQATIESATDAGVNTLTYSPLRFWPNQEHEETVEGTSQQKRDYCTFFAYYPWNPTAVPGEYGISITESTIANKTVDGKLSISIKAEARPVAE